ncbi:hypothetical protein J6590_102827, partial [Homalodisca vitripennis]
GSRIPRLDFRLHKPTSASENSLLELASLHDVSKQKLSVPCRIGCISRPPAGHAQRRVFVSRRQTLQRSHRSSG